MRQVAAVVLAAGASTRLGEAKQLVRLGGERLLERAVRVAFEAGLGEVVVVLGCGAETIRGVCELNGTRVAVNQRWEEGMGSSVRVGVSAISREMDGVLLMTCDQPAVSAAHLALLVGDEVAASSYAGRRGVPAYFPRARFGGLLGLRGDAGARELLAGVRTVTLAGGEVDVDTPEGLAAARASYE